ncbi:hypothetical protein XSR1_410004 [Xenorhabdus szentirmaii DSM 16338]|uniref:Uncharacterized protein n=2 Tax=Xenorhabdus szentirmaii TaxID=290112 RepID=W1J2A4_9GAMM|nr:hypothetical protein XSR1_410004 [Xenorhabdus szentirmaii DSM 16338]
MKKILWVKFGWSNDYCGGPVDGNFYWLDDNKEKRGNEAFNFAPESDGTYYCYVPPQTGKYALSNNDPDGWTVICLAKNPKYPGIHIVGWYEDATLHGEFWICLTTLSKCRGMLWVRLMTGRIASPVRQRILFHTRLGICRSRMALLDKESILSLKGRV